jgi:hypothetical protein
MVDECTGNQRRDWRGEGGNSKSNCKAFEAQLLFRGLQE